MGLEFKFDKSKVRYTCKVVEARFENIKSPYLRPQLKIQVIEDNDLGYGPIQLIFDLKHIVDPRKSKPLAFANLTPGQTVDLAIQLIKAYLFYTKVNPDLLIHHIKRRVVQS